MTKNKSSSKQNREYTYNFVGGGWNSELATSKQEAYKKACKRWENRPNLCVDKKSFRIATEAETKNLLSMFW